MMCLVRLADGEITGWLIGTDIYDLRQKAQDRETGALLSGADFPEAGKHDLGNGYWLLVT